jgi:hypothetical protein
MVQARAHPLCISGGHGQSRATWQAIALKVLLDEAGTEVNVKLYQR